MVGQKSLSTLLVKRFRAFFIFNFKVFKETLNSSIRFDLKITPTYKLWIQIYTVVIAVSGVITGCLILVLNNKVVLFERTTVQSNLGE